MYTPREVLARRKGNAPGRHEPEAVPGGVRRLLAETADHLVRLENLVPHSYQGAWRAARGSRTYVVLDGALWIREDKGTARRLERGQAFSTTPGRTFEIATGEIPASVLVIEPPGLSASLEAVPSDRAPSPGGGAAVERLRFESPRPRQGTFDERTARANAAQGLGRTQPLPARTQSAAEVSFGFSIPGTNLAPVVPEP